MGSGDWLRTIITLKKMRPSKSKISENVKAEDINLTKSNESNEIIQDQSSDFPAVLDETAAAVRIQTAFRSHKARETFQLKRSEKRLKNFSQRNSVKGQTASAVKYMQSWHKIQTEISARRRSIMVDRAIAEKKPGAKHLAREANWRGGPGTREEFIARRRQREEAVAKRERAMAYALAHQMRVNPGVKPRQQGQEQGEEQWNWNWSWTEKASPPPGKTTPKFRRRTLSSPAIEISA